MSLPSPDTSTFLYLSDKGKLEQIRQEMVLPEDARIILMEATIGEDQRNLEKRARKVAELPENAGAYIVLSHSNSFACIQSTGKALENFDTLIAESRVRHRQQTHRRKVAEIFSLEEEAQNYVYNKEHHKLDEWLTGFADFVWDAHQENISNRNGEKILFHGKWNGHTIGFPLWPTDTIDRNEIKEKLERLLAGAQESQIITSVTSQLQNLWQMGLGKRENIDNIQTPIELCMWLYNICLEESFYTHEEQEKLKKIIDDMRAMPVEKFVGDAGYEQDVLTKEYNSFQDFLYTLERRLENPIRSMDRTMAKALPYYISNQAHIIHKNNKAETST